MRMGEEMTLAHDGINTLDRPGRMKPWGDTEREIDRGIEEQADCSSETGAARLAKTIRDFWQRRDGVVEMRTEKFHHGLNRTPVVCVRSDMVNGLPAAGRRI